MRGKQLLAIGYLPQARNIPAYAGKTFTTKKIHVRHAEHPRVCGENDVRLISGLPSFGTSPRMRGKPATSAIVEKGPRNIPAYAGKTLASAREHIVDSEHPRVCGENGLNVP